MNESSLLANTNYSREYLASVNKKLTHYLATSSSSTTTTYDVVNNSYAYTHTI